MIYCLQNIIEFPILNTGGDDLITKDGEEGFVVSIRDVEAIKDKILYLYNNQDIAKEMG